MAAPVFVGQTAWEYVKPDYFSTITFAMPAGLPPDYFLFFRAGTAPYVCVMRAPVKAGRVVTASTTYSGVVAQNKPLGNWNEYSETFSEEPGILKTRYLRNEGTWNTYPSQLGMSLLDDVNAVENWSENTSVQLAIIKGV